MKPGTRLDQVSIFEDKLTFLIPHDWIEGDEDGNDYLYHLPDARSGWFRAGLLTVPAGPLEDMFQGSPNVKVDTTTGNWVSSWVKDTTEDGAVIRLYYWKVANTVANGQIRDAIFSYCILQQDIGTADNDDMVELLDYLLRSVKFK